MSTSNPIAEYMVELHSLMRFYNDALFGFKLVSSYVLQSQHQSIKSLRNKKPELANLEYLDNVNFFYGQGNPQDPNSRILSYCKQGEMKIRNAANGVNSNIAAYSLISIAYGLWEAKYRKEISEFLGIEGLINAVPIGDMRKFRHDILHCRGICSKSHSAKTEIFQWFKEGDSLAFTREMIIEMLIEIKTCLEEQFEKHTGQKIKLSIFLDRTGWGE